MGLSTKITYSITATSINVGAGLVRNKIFAAFLSVNLFGILSIGQQSTSLLFTLFAFGLPLGVSTYASHLVVKSRDEQIEEISRLVALVALLAAFAVVVLSFALLIDAEAISRLVTNDPSYALPIGVLLFAAPLMVIETSLYAMMEGMGNLRGIVTFKVIPSVVALPIIYVLAAKHHLVGAAAGLVVNEVLLVVTGMYVLRDSVVVRKSILRLRPAFISVFKVALLSVLVGFGWMLTDFVVKRSILGTLGEVNNGIVQSVSKITDTYPTVVLSWLTMHVFPLAAINKDDKVALASMLQRTLVVAMSLVVPIILILFAMRPVVLDLLYKHDFVIGSSYFGAALTTGIPKVYSWVVGVVLLPLGMRRQWFVSAMILSAVYAIGVWLGLQNDFSIYAIPVGLVLGLSAQAAYTLFACRKFGIVFGRSFTEQTGFFAALTVFFAIAVVHPYTLIPAALLYFVVLKRSGLLREIRDKLYAKRSEAAA